MAQIKTTRARADFSTNREKLDFAEQIALLDPNENPMTLMTMKYKKKTSGNIKHSWLYDELVSESDTVDGQAVTADTGITVDNVDRWAVGDIARVIGADETILVTSISSDTLTVVRDYGATSGAYTALADTIADGAYLQIIGNAFEAGHELPVAKSTQETQLDNWCQDQRTTFGITEIAEMAAVHGEQDWPFQQRKAGISHMRKLEYQNLFGHPMPGDKGLSASGTGNTDPAAGGGLLHFLTGGTGFSGTGSDRLVTDAALTQADFLSWLEAGFEYGSSQKVMFCAPILRSALDSWGISKYNTFENKESMGMNVSKWVSSHGTIVFVTHKMLKPVGSEGAYNFLVDMDDLAWVTYSSKGATRMRMLDPYSATGKTIKQGEYQTISCLEVRTPKKHALLKGVTSYS